jgi:hypothetical protein
MAQRATAFSKKKEVNPPPAFASVSAADIIRAPLVHRAVALELLPLIKPLKRQGRLLLRVERVPQRAKLSQGRRNGDGSWSLASDELEGLNYLVPSNIVAEHELTIRVMSFEDGETLKVLQFPIPRGEGAPELEDGGETLRAATPAEEAPLRNQLGEMQSLFAARESELAELRAALDRVHGEKAAELASAKAAWEAELKQRLSEAAARTDTDRKRDEARQAEHESGKTALAEAEAERKLTAERKRWQGEVDQHLQTEQRRWQSDASKHLEAEQRRWQASSEERLATERRNWQAETDRRVGEERERWQIEADQHFDAEHRRWEASTEQRIETERRSWQAEVERRVKAEWEQWQAKADRLSDDEHKRWESSTGERLETERRNWQAEADRRLEAERARLENQRLADLRHAAELWKSDEAGRSAAARAEWQQRSDQMQAEEADKRARLEAALAQALTQASNRTAMPDNATDMERLRMDLAEAKKSLGERDLELVRHRTEFEQERERWRRDIEATLEKAALAWKKEEAARLDGIVAKTRLESDETLAALSLRCERAERALAEARNTASAQASMMSRRPDDAYVERLRTEVAALQASLASREVELGQVRAALQQTPPPSLSRPMNRPIGNFPGHEERVPAGRPLVREFAIVFAVLVPAILFYPNLAGYLPSGLRSGLASATGGVLSTAETRPPAPPSSVIVPAPAPAPVAPRPTTIVNRSANVHAMPSTKGDTVTTLPRNATVTVVEQRGNWTLVEIPAPDGGKPQQGWVFNSYLGEKKTEPSVKPDAPKPAAGETAGTPPASPAIVAAPSPAPANAAAAPDSPAISPAPNPPAPAAAVPAPPVPADSH